MSKRIGKIHCIIPDCQIRPGVSIEHLRWVGNYIAEKKPDVIVQIGDFADMPSLNSHHTLIENENKRYKKDIEAAKKGMDALFEPIRKVKGYNPKLILTLGNHEDRINSLIKDNPKLAGSISIDDLEFEKYGWNVVPFLKVARVDGWEYSHYFTNGSSGRPVTSAQTLLRERQSSAVQGHVQYTDIAVHKRTGRIAILCGICYLHDEAYLTQANSARRQIVMLHEVSNGIGDPMLVSLRFLKRNYS